MEDYLQRPPEGYQASPSDKMKYQRILGITMHIACYMRPDIAYSINSLAQYASNPTNAHWEALKRIWRYLKGTKTIGCYYNGNAELQGWTDSSWNELLQDGHSTSGYIFLLAGRPISWSSKKQQTVATSTTVAEYYAQYHAATELSWIRELIQELQIDDIDANKPTIMYADNKGAISLTESTAYHKRSKHIAARYHWTRDMIWNKEVELYYLPTDEMMADGLTKPLKAIKHTEFVRIFGLKRKEDVKVKGNIWRSWRTHGERQRRLRQRTRSRGRVVRLRSPCDLHSPFIAS